MMFPQRRWRIGVAAVVTVFGVVAPVVDRFVFPEANPPVWAYPAEGQVFHSQAEGFSQRIVTIDDDLIWSELTLHPHAPGPPAHLHTTFAERFIVVKGEVSILVEDETKVVRVGEEFVVEPGTVHKPFNATGEEAVVRGPNTAAYGLPRDFGVFLTQAYGFFDESPDNGRAPLALFQMSRFSPRYDSWPAGPPVFVQRGGVLNARPNRPCNRIPVLLSAFRATGQWVVAAAAPRCNSRVCSWALVQPEVAKVTRGPRLERRRPPARAPSTASSTWPTSTDRLGGATWPSSAATLWPGLP